jgi:hypothetical protein
MSRALFAIAAAALSAGVCAAQPQASQPAAGAPAPSAAARAAPPPLGRLFFSPSERAQLDIARLQRKPATAAAPEALEAPPAPQIVTYGGIVRRSDGRRMLWLNNRLVDEKEALAGLSLKGKVKPNGAVTLQSESGESVEVKVGQTVELYSGKVAETRKPAPDAAKPAADAKAPAEGGRTAEAKPAAAAPKPDTPAKPPAAESTGTKPPPAATGLKMDLGGRAPANEEAARTSSSK